MSAYHVCFNVDNAYVKYAAVTIHSIIAAAVKAAGADHTPFVFHILADGLSAENHDYCQLLAKSESARYPCSIVCHQADEQTFKGLRRWGEGSGLSAYLRLLLPQLFDTSIERVLYLDADLIALQDVRPLFAVDLDGKILGAVPDLFVADYMLKFKSSRLLLPGRVLSFGQDEAYFNSGVMLLDLKLWRESHITERCMKMLRRYKVRMPDQDVLNLVLQGQVKFLQLKWNFLCAYVHARPGNLASLKNNLQNKSTDFLAQYRGCTQLPLCEIAILHYTGVVKPWKGRFSHMEDGVLQSIKPQWRQPWLNLAANLPVYGAEFSALAVNDKAGGADTAIIEAVNTAGLVSDKRYNVLKRRCRKLKQALLLLTALLVVQTAVLSYLAADLQVN